MRDINQNMEELFRKAADNYPLKSGDSSWDDISRAVLNKPVENQATKKKQSRKYIVLLLFLLPLFLKDGIITNNEMIDSSRRVFEIETSIPMMTNKTAGNTTTGNNKDIIQMQTVGAEYIKGKKDHSLLVEQNLPDFLTSAKRSTSTVPVSIFRQESFSVNKEMTPENVSLAQMENAKPIEKSIDKKQDPHPKSLYMGLTTGVLFDEVKNQGMAGTGYSIGIITGYRFNNHLSLETGLLYAKKPYYSSGRYFSMNKISSAMPSGMEIVSLEGHNAVWEIPVRVKYDFFERNKSKLFTSAGITSYIITYEKNNYLVEMSGVQHTMNGAYKNKSRSLAATFDISAGYEHKIGKSNYFRIEPYIQIPLRGMGVGSMQMISTGLRIGITKFPN